MFFLVFGGEGSYSETQTEGFLNVQRCFWPYVYSVNFILSWHGLRRVQPCKQYPIYFLCLKYVGHIKQKKKTNKIMKPNHLEAFYLSWHSLTLSFIRHHFSTPLLLWVVYCFSFGHFRASDLTDPFCLKRCWPVWLSGDGFVLLLCWFGEQVLNQSYLLTDASWWQRRAFCCELERLHD